MAVVAVLTDVEGNGRDYFLPPSYAKKFDKRYADPSTINCYKMYLKLTGFTDWGEHKVPKLEFVYRGGAQLLD